MAAEDLTAIDLSGVRYSITTEAAVADKIRAWVDTPEAAGLGWTKATVSRPSTDIFCDEVISHVGITVVLTRAYY